MATSEPALADCRSNKQKPAGMELIEIRAPDSPFGESKPQKNVTFDVSTIPPPAAPEPKSGGKRRVLGSLPLKTPKIFKRGSTERLQDDGPCLGRAGAARIAGRPSLTPHDDTPDASTVAPLSGQSGASAKGCKKTQKPYINLHKAIQNNNADVVRDWLSYNRDRPSRNRIKDKHGYAPVHYATKFNRLQFLTDLCTEGKADVCEKTISEEYTPLHFAARFNPSCHDFSVDEQTDCDQSSDEAQNVEGESVESDGKQSSSHPPGLNRQTSIEKVLKFLMDQEKVNVNVVDKFGITPLHLACQVGNTEAVGLLLKSPRIDLAAKDVNGDTPLHEACFHGKGDVVTILLTKIKETEGKVDSMITDKNNLGLTPFHLACREGYSKIVAELFKFADNHKSLVTAGDYEDSTPLHLACQGGNAGVVQSLLDEGADMFDVNHDGVCPVHIAAQFGSVEVMKKLVEFKQHDQGVINEEGAVTEEGVVNKGAVKEEKKVVNVQDKYHQTPLHFATEYGKKPMVEYLIKKNAKINARDIDNYTPLLTAAEFGQTAAFKLLLKHGASLDVQSKSRKSALFLAAESNHPEIIEIILELNQGDEVHQICSKVDTSKNTPLHIAAEKGHVKPLKTLLQHLKSGCQVMEIDVKNVLNKTIMHLAAENGHLHVVAELQHDCSLLVKSTDENGNTPLHLACMHGFVEVAKLLMKMEGADIGARNEILWTPIDCAASNGHARVIRELVTAKAEIDPKDKLKTTPLHLAAKEGHVTAVETLIEHNASISSRDHRGFNALDWAIESGHRDVAEAIIKSSKWKYALRNHTIEQDGKETTPFRKLIQRMPDIAEMVLKRCTTTNAKVGSGLPNPEEYSVIFNYEFLEDRKRAKEWKDDAENQAKETQCQINGKKKSWFRNYYSSQRLKHPLQVMVDSKRTELLKHPLVYKLIEHKWQYTQILFWVILIFHALFVTFLTAYALLLLNPFSPTCVAVSLNQYNIRQPEDFVSINTSNLQPPHDQVIMDLLANTSSTVGHDNIANISGYTLCFNVSTTVRDALHLTNDIPVDAICGSCGLTIHRMTFVFSAAVIVIFLSICQLLMEAIQFFQQPQVYFTDLASWIKAPYTICAIMFALAILNDCLCPKSWQWQVGIVAVFLVWADLIFYVRKVRVLDTGIYILMFEKIFKRFLRLTVFTVLLVSMFALTFHMAFHQLHPLFERSPFATPFHALWKTLTMTTGEVDYDNLFRQPSEAFTNSKEVPGLPFPEISYILWIAFLVLMPILFTNLLVGLAVDDIKGILEAAELTRLALRVKLILNLEDGFLKCIRKSRRPVTLVLYPYKKNFKRRFPLVWKLWRGEDYRSAEHIADVVNPTQTPVEQQTQSLMRQMSKMHNTLQQIPKIHESLQQIPKMHESLQQIPKIHESLQRMQEDLCALAEQLKTLKQREL